MQKLVAGISSDNPAGTLVEVVRRIKAGTGDGTIDDSNAAEVVAFLERFLARGKWKLDYSKKDATDTWLERLEYLTDTIEESDIVISQFQTRADNILDAVFSELSEAEFGFAELKANEKQQIYKLISELRKLIETSKLNTRKKNALFTRLSELELEVDKRSTRTDRFFGTFSELGFALGDFGEQAKPMFDRMREILQIIYARRSKDEGVKLPPSEMTKFLELKQQDDN